MGKLNVLLICVDQWSGKFTGAMGHRVIKTPTLDSLVQCGINYSNAYSECPVCIPARRTIMTGLSPKNHGNREYCEKLEMPKVQTLAESFKKAGYQAFAVGKMHVYPQRNRIGFDDIILHEEGRNQFGVSDDYQVWLTEQGFGGEEFGHGMSNNEYLTRPWHLPEKAHPTNWSTREMIKMIRRRDPTKPALFYLSYQFPHPPLVPIAQYFDMYEKEEIDSPVLSSDWLNVKNFTIAYLQQLGKNYSLNLIRAARQAYYAQCTYIDHQLRLLIGTLREEGVLSNTLIAFTSDHGEMLGNHKMWGKRSFYENSAKIPMIISGEYIGNRNEEDTRLVGQIDLMPTLLDICEIDHGLDLDGLSVFSSNSHKYLFGEINEVPSATRMIHDGRFKLIYYPVGNYFQLFDLNNDPEEQINLVHQEEFFGKFRELEKILIQNLNSGDEKWVHNDVLEGLEDRDFSPNINLRIGNQRGVNLHPQNFNL